VLVAENELEKALDFFKFALTASPNVSLFWANYIDTLAKLERIIEAKALIKAAKNSGMSCENIEAISHRLDTENQEPLAKDTREIDEFITQQKFDDAIKACLSLMETYPSSGILNITLGKCYFELGQMELAKSSFIKATEYSPLWNISFVMLGQVYSSQGDLDEAINSYKKSLKIKPG
jgi:tetratricopeptide (TPR) repeat protein